MQLTGEANGGEVGAIDAQRILKVELYIITQTTRCFRHERRSCRKKMA